VDINRTTREIVKLAKMASTYNDVITENNQKY
jgi:hypothetical protein